jgi:hypothetical protein
LTLPSSRQSDLFNWTRFFHHDNSMLPYAEKYHFYLVGYGSSFDDCGEIRSLKCDNFMEHPEGKIFIRYYKHNCKRPSCPLCMEGWAASEAEHALLRFCTYLSSYDEVAEIIECAKEEFHGEPRELLHRSLVMRLEELAVRKRVHNKANQVKHFVVSPPPDTIVTEENYVKKRSEVEKIARKRGVKGGIVVFHPYRLHCKKCDVRVDDYSKTCVKCGGSDFHWVPSPHWHVIGFGYIATMTKKEYHEIGWVVVNLGVRESIFWTVQYVLSHAGVYVDPEGKKHFKIVSWFGVLSYNKKLVVPVVDVVYQFCPYCGGRLHGNAVYTGEDDPPEFDPDDCMKNSFLANPKDWGY